MRSHDGRIAGYGMKYDRYDDESDAETTHRGGKVYVNLPTRKSDPAYQPSDVKIYNIRDVKK